MDKERAWSLEEESARLSLLAEGEGFEPSVAIKTTTVFETVPFVHSGTLPILSELEVMSPATERRTVPAVLALLLPGHRARRRHGG